MATLAGMQYQIPEHLARFIGPGLAKEAKLMAARGMLPLPPRDLIHVLFALSRDPDPALQETARQSMLKMPENILHGLLAEPNQHVLLLDFMARHLSPESPLQETIALNRVTSDETIVFQASLPNKRLVDIISENQLRLLRWPPIVDAISENPYLGQAQLDKIIKLVEMETRRTARLAKPGEAMEVEIEEIKEEEIPPVTEEEVATVTEDEAELSPWARMTFDHDLLRDHDVKSEEEEQEVETNLYRKVSNMKVAEKIKLALMGGKQARDLLIRDSNKIVATAVLKSPRITENEIENISRSRSVSDEVIRIIANNREWTRNYHVKLNLVQNPKTPMSEVMRFMNYLRDKDLADLSRSRNVSSQVAAQAKRMIARKEEKAKPKAKEK